MLNLASHMSASAYTQLSFTTSKKLGRGFQQRLIVAVSVGVIIVLRVWL